MTSRMTHSASARNTTPSRLLAAIGLAMALALAGCASGSANASKSKGNVTVITLPNQAEQIASAQQLALRAQKTKDPAEAIDLYSRAVAEYADLPAAWNNMGVLLLGEGRLMEAAEAFSSAAERTPNDPRPLFNLGLTWDRAGYLETALEHYASALARDSRYLPALRGAIKAEIRLGNSSPILVERIQTAILLEQDPQWREYLELQRSWAEAEVRAKAGLPVTGAIR
ncbi:MAG: tetratricopeptide repeat protein [Phycisphaeraceae bacterium]|nr:tetratricopeptide repeat protein [Phycisphaeraceae bacterium]MCB9847244.1 tetratricopeptide repeat protein [Phycisphaeraceae bacterium]